MLLKKSGSRERKKAPEKQRQRRSSGRPVLQKYKEKSVIAAWLRNTAIGDIVNHQTFSKGIVMKLYADKCDMLFKDRERLMAPTNE